VLQFYITSDGSHTLLNTDLNETYHSRYGAIQESMHVFIKNGLHWATAGLQGKELQLLEVGFGTGLNALLTLMHTTIPVKYTTLEPTPLELSIIRQLNYTTLLECKSDLSNAFQKMHTAPWGQPQTITSLFTIHKINAALQNTPLSPGSFDLLYYDAFAPGKQPEMWEFQTLEHLARSIKAGGYLVTYCAKGQLKRDLKMLGFTVETLPGSPGKAEMVRARRSGSQ